jgi:hypothetical protein
MTGTNALAYNKLAIITTVKSKIASSEKIGKDVGSL